MTLSQQMAVNFRVNFALRLYLSFKPSYLAWYSPEATSQPILDPPIIPAGMLEVSAGANMLAILLPENDPRDGLWL